MRRHAPFFVILAGYFIVAGLFAIRVPAWQAPDEPAHYNVVRQIAELGGDISAFVPPIVLKALNK